jgi:hypothetical protein
MRNRRLLILVAALLASPAVAQQRWQPEDHLEPEHSVLGGAGFLSGYDALVRDLLHQAYDPSVQVRMVAMPSFVPEYAVGLRGGKKLGKGAFTATTRGAPYRIFVLSPEVQIWTYESIASLHRGQQHALGKEGAALQKQAIARLQSRVPADPHNVKITRCEVGISDGLGDRIVKAWEMVLLSTRYSAQYPGGADGVSYHFSGFVPKAGMLDGQVWTPPRDTATGTLVTLADTMRAICEKKNGATEAQLEKVTAELEQRLARQENRK